MDPTYPNRVTIILPASTSHLTKITRDELGNAIVAFGLFRANNHLNGNPYNPRIVDYYDGKRKLTFQASDNLADQIKALGSPVFAFETVSPTVIPIGRRRGQYYN